MDGHLIELYGLFDPVSGELRYIGKARDSKKRLASHFRDARRRNTPVYCWIRKLGSEGRAPEVRVLERVPADEWQAAEVRLIAESRARGDRLLNVADGGDNPKAGPETLRKNAAKLNKRLQEDPLFRELRRLKCEMGLSLKKGWVSNQTRAKLRALAQKSPELFGDYANIQDRVECP